AVDVRHPVRPPGHGEGPVEQPVADRLGPVPRLGPPGRPPPLERRGRGGLVGGLHVESGPVRDDRLEGDRPRIGRCSLELLLEAPARGPRRRPPASDRNQAVRPANAGPRANTPMTRRAPRCAPRAPGPAATTTSGTCP